MNRQGVVLIAALGVFQGPALAGEPVPPASRPDPVAPDMVRSFREQQVVITPPPPSEPGRRATVPARVLFSPWPEPPMTLEQAYYAGLMAGEARWAASGDDARAVVPPPPPSPTSYRPSWTWIPSFGFGIGSHGSLFHFGLSGLPPYRGWGPW